MVLDGSETDFVKTKAKEVIKEPKIGRVVQVYEHLTPSDDSNFEVDVVIDGDQFEERAVSYNGESSGQMAAPKVGDKVVIDYLAGDRKRPVCMGTAYSNEDRAPLGRAGMYRDVYESDSSPVGDGDVTVTGYTQYTDNPARVDKSEIDPVQAWYQIAKFPQSPDPVPSDNAPMSIEMYDSPSGEKDEAHIRFNGTAVDGDSSKALDITLDFKTGQIKVAATDSSEFGLVLDAKTGEFKILDDGGYGIESDSNGNFTWHYESIDYSQGTTTSL